MWAKGLLWGHLRALKLGKALPQLVRSHSVEKGEGQKGCRNLTKETNKTWESIPWVGSLFWEFRRSQAPLSKEKGEDTTGQKGSMVTIVNPACGFFLASFSLVGADGGGSYRCDPRSNHMPWLQIRKTLLYKVLYR